MARRTCLVNCSLTTGLPFMTAETVATETPASRLTSRIVVLPGEISFLMLNRLDQRRFKYIASSPDRPALQRTCRASHARYPMQAGACNRTVICAQTDRLYKRELQLEWAGGTTKSSKPQPSEVKPSPRSHRIQ